MKKKSTKKSNKTSIKVKSTIKTKSAPKEKKPGKKRRKIVIKAKPRPAHLVEMDEVMKRINTVQTEKKTVKFSVELHESLVIDNILQDVGVVFSKKSHGESVNYEVSPGPEIPEG